MNERMREREQNRQKEGMNERKEDALGHICWFHQPNKL